MNTIEKHLSILGSEVKDKITGVSGVAESVCFDLYGCVQVCINQGIDKEGKMKETRWIDIARLQITSSKKRMDAPDWNQDKGPAEKPDYNA
jgi:hypothetical protein